MPESRARRESHPATCQKKISSSVAARNKKAPSKAATLDHSFAETERGEGTPACPIKQPLRDVPNDSGCLHCPTAQCLCEEFADAYFTAVERTSLKRITEVAGNNALCAKSLNPNFVARLAYLLDVRPSDTFYDLGCGNGSILFQMALLTGARCIGVEISAHNAQVGRETWTVLKPLLEERFERQLPDVTIITGDLTELLRNPNFYSSRSKILTSNLLMPRSLTHFMSEAFRALPVGSKVACFDDLYPHARACSQSRDPEAFALFQMKDYVWPPLAVEWCSVEGPFFVHTRV